MLIPVQRDGIAVHKNKDRTLWIDTVSESIFIEDREQYLEKVKSVRPHIWAEQIKPRIARSNVSEEDMKVLEDLFVTGRIDAQRAFKAIDTNSLPPEGEIDPDIMTGDKEKIQVYLDEWYNIDKILVTLEEKYGLDGVDKEDHKEAALYKKEEERLRRLGKLRPGISGI